MRTPLKRLWPAPVLRFLQTCLPRPPAAQTSTHEESEQPHSEQPYTEFMRQTGALPALIQAFISGAGECAAREDTHAPAKKAFQDKIATLDFSTDCFSSNIPHWTPILAPLAAQSPHILEIGSWEGTSALFFLSLLPAARITCVDTWAGSDEHAGKPATREIERRFDANTAPFADRIEKVKGTSFAFFHARQEAEAFDVVYIDGSHYADDVMLDLVRGFDALKTGGLMLMDDYLWKFYPRLRDNPAGAINAFLAMKEGLYDVLHVGWQVHIRKTGQSSRG